MTTPGTSQEAPCPRCGQAVSLTPATSETGGQLAAETTECPNCGAALRRAIEGHADQGWRLAGEEAGA
jgi:ribosomal protein S27AE